MVRVQFFNGWSTVPLWLEYSPFMVGVLFLYGCSTVPLRLEYSPFMVGVLSLYGWSTVPLWLEYSPFRVFISLFISLFHVLQLITMISVVDQAKYTRQNLAYIFLQMS